MPKRIDRLTPEQEYRMDEGLIAEMTSPLVESVEKFGLVRTESDTKALADMAEGVMIKVRTPGTRLDDVRLECLTALEYAFTMGRMSGCADMLGGEREHLQSPD